MDSDQYIVEPETSYTPFSDIQARQYFGATRGYSVEYNGGNYNTDAMSVPRALPVRTAETKFMAGQVGMPAYVLNYQHDSGVPYGASVDKSIIPGFMQGNPTDYGRPMGSGRGDSLSVVPGGVAGDASSGTREYYPRALVIDSQSPLPGRVPPQAVNPASQQAKTAWPWPISGFPHYEPCVGANATTNNQIVITLDPNMIILFIFIAVIALCYVTGTLINKIEKIAKVVGGSTTNNNLDTDYPTRMPIDT